MTLPSARPQRRPRSLTASASRLGGVKDSEYSRRVGLPWQRRALSYIDLVPEVNYASRFYARMLKQVKLYPALLDDSENTSRIETGPPVDLLARIQDPGGGRSQILGSYGRLAFATGEGLLFGRNLDTENERWAFIWNDELKVTLGKDDEVVEYQWRPSPREAWQTFVPQDADGEPKAVAYRMWTPHPALSGEADSPMRACLDIAEELIILTKSVHSTAVSRLVRGMLLIPQQLSQGAIDAVGDEDPLVNPFIADLVDHIEAQIENAGTAAAMAPFLVEGDYDYIDRVQHIQLHNPETDFMEQGLRKEAIERLGFGLDMPPEVLRGLSESNHWASMQILNDMWRSHGAPVANQFASDLNQVYLRPALRDLGFQDWNRVVIVVDPSEIVGAADRSKDADDAATLGYISAEGYRTLKNIPEDYAPSEEEHMEWVAIKMRDPLLLGTGTAPVPDAQNPPAQPGPEGDSGRQTRVVGSAGLRESGAAELALARCRELAGIRVRQKEKHCPECVQAANGHPNALVAAAIGEHNVQKLQLEPFGLVKGGADTLRSLLVAWGYGEPEAHMIGDLVEVFAARTLFEQQHPSLPDMFATQFEKLLEVA